MRALLLLGALLGSWGCGDGSLDLLRTCTAPEPPIDLDPVSIVSAEFGNDLTAQGNCTAHATITHALGSAMLGDIIWVAPGRYDVDGGEVFPIQIPPNVSLVGDIGNKGRGQQPTTIVGHGPVFEKYSATVAGSTGARIAGFDFETGISKSNYCVFSADTDMAISDSTFSKGYGGIRLQGGGNSEILGNVFRTPVYAIYMKNTGVPLIQHNIFLDGSHIEVVGGKSVIRGNRFEGTHYSAISVWYGRPQILNNLFESSNESGSISTKYKSSPIVRNNTFKSLDGIAVKISDDSLPDLGSREDRGGNSFESEQGIAIALFADQVISAIGNTWRATKPVCRFDLIVVGGPGEIIWGLNPDERCEGTTRE